MSRTLPYLAELQPEMFCEVSPELAAERGLEHGGWATIVTARTAIEARVLVTDRIAPLRVDGRIVHQVGLPYHWGGRGARRRGDSPTTCSRSRSTRTCTSRRPRRRPATCAPGRRPRGPALLDAASSGYRRAGGRRDMTQEHRSPTDARPPTATEARDRAMGFFTDTTRLHRLQGVRGRVQGVERRARRPARLHAASPTTTRRAGRQHLAARRLRRAAAAGRRGRRTVSPEAARARGRAVDADEAVSAG